MAQDVSPEYRCQKCNNPLVIHESLKEITPAQTKLLINRVHSQDNQDQTTIPQDRLDSFNDIIAKAGNLTPLEERYLLDEADTTHIGSTTEWVNQAISASRQPPGSSMAASTQKLERLFDVLSLATDIDFPVCTDCARLIMEGLKTTLNRVQNERDMYVQFLKKLKVVTKSAGSEGETPSETIDKSKDVMNDYLAVSKEEDAALNELKAVETEYNTLVAENTKLQQEIASLDGKESEFWTQRNDLQLQIQDTEFEYEKLSAQYEFLSAHLAKLEKTNVYNDVFNISHDGIFGTINGLRLGTCEKRIVPWTEINAALGHVVYLLDTIMRKQSIKLENYRLRALGSYSAIEKRETNTISGKTITTLYNLYSSDQSMLSRIFTQSSFDNGLVCLLQVIQEIGQFMVSTSNSGRTANFANPSGRILEMPHAISKDKIGGISIRISAKGAGEEWTTACKLMLTE